MIYIFLLFKFPFILINGNLCINYTTFNEYNMIKCLC